ncbi:DUF6118 family protein [Rhodoblastus sp.]|uniref:DUF6118 family protein n=1 Tax=Rhodoblastus sp. TaxID=1962975 RepID=UPI003F9CF359
MADEDDQDDGGAAQAFAELRAEIAIMRKAIEVLPEAIENVAVPDYAPSFGALAKGLTGVEARLAGIEAHPAIRMAPEQQARAIERAGAEITREAARALRDEADAVKRERQALGGIVGAARDRQAQSQALLWALGAGAAAGLVLFPLLGAFAPGGSYLAAWATGTADRWQAGAGLMQAANPAGAQALAAASRLVNANAEALQTCSEAARKAGKEQKCVVVVAPQGP